MSVGRSGSGISTMLGLGMELNISRALTFGSWLVGLDGGSVTVVVSNVVDLSVDSMGISVSVASLDIAVTVSVLLSGLLEVSGVVVSSYDVESVLVGDGLGL